jgi:hypothetical protein
MGFGVPILAVGWLAKQEKRYREAVGAARTPRMLHTTPVACPPL